jgi:serine protease Do
MGVGFAIPSDMASHVMHSIIDKGFVTRGWLGAMIQDLNDELAKSFGYESKEGVLIGDVVADGPAAKAGLKAGDIVTKYNDQPVRSANELRNAVAATAPESNAKLQIFRDGERKSLTVRINQLDQEKVSALKIGGESANELGIRVETLTSDRASQLGADANSKGVVVTEVDDGSLAARVGIERGDIVVAVGNESTSTVEEFRKAIRKQDLKNGIRLQLMREGMKRFVFIRSE